MPTLSTCSDLVIQKSSKKVSGRSCPSVDGDHYPLIRPHPPARPSKRSGQKALSGLCCVRACPVSLISPMLDYVNEQWSSDLMSALFPSHCPRPLDRGSNQAHTSSESSPRIVSENNQGSCQRIPKDRVTESQRIVSPRNGVVVGFVAGAHCGSCRIVGHWRAGQGCAIK